MDLNLRRLRYFAVIAQELHYGRAAARLHIAQPVLTRQIAVLERELGVALLERSPRGTALTPAGAELLDGAHALLDAATRLQRRARSAGRQRSLLAVGFMPGTTVSPVVGRLRERFPHLEVEVVRTGYDDQVEVVRDGRVDASIVRLPASTEGLAVLPLFSEPRVVALPAEHVLAADASVTLERIASLDLLQPPDAHPDWRAAALAVRADALAHRDDLPIVSTVEEKLEQVAQGRGIVLLPESAAMFYSRPDVVYRFVDGLDPVETALVHDPASASPVLRALLELAPEAYRGASS